MADVELISFHKSKRPQELIRENYTEGKSEGPSPSLPLGAG